MPPQVAGLAIPLLDDDNDLSSEEPSPLSPSRHVDAHRRIYSLPLTGVWCTECNKPAHGLPKELINHVREKENLIKGLMSVVASLKLEKVQWNRLWCFECDEPAHGLSNKTREKLRQGNQTISGKKAIKPEMAVAQRALAVEARLPDVKSPVSPREVGRGNRSPSFNRRHHPKSPTKQTPIAVVPRSDNPNFRSPLLQVGSDVASPSSVAIINRDLVGLKITPSPIPTSPLFKSPQLLYHERITQEDPSNRIAKNRIPVMQMNRLGTSFDPSNRLTGLPSSPLRSYSQNGNGRSPQVKLAVSPHSVSPFGMSPSPRLVAPVHIKTSNGIAITVPPTRSRQPDECLL